MWSNVALTGSPLPKTLTNVSLSTGPHEETVAFPASHPALARSETSPDPVLTSTLTIDRANRFELLPDFPFRHPERTEGSQPQLGPFAADSDNPPPCAMLPGLSNAQPRLCPDEVRRQRALTRRQCVVDDASQPKWAIEPMLALIAAGMKFHAVVD